MNYTQSKDQLLTLIREGGKLDWMAQVKLAALLSFPSMLAQMVHILMQYIDASMVGSLGARASASIGLVSTTIWLFGSLCSAVCLFFIISTAFLWQPLVDRLPGLKNDLVSGKKTMRIVYILIALMILGFVS